MDKEGIVDFRWHDLRHTWASWLIQAGVPLAALQEMGGWESVEMVRRYTHLSAQHLQNYAALLDKMNLAEGTNLTHLDKGKEKKDIQVIGKFGGSGGDRTHDQGIMSPLL